MSVQGWIIQDVRLVGGGILYLECFQEEWLPRGTRKSPIGDAVDLHISRLCVFLGEIHSIGHASMNKKLKRQLLTATLILVGLFVVFAIVSRIA